MSTKQAKGADLFLTSILLCQIVLTTFMSFKPHDSPATTILILTAVAVVPQHMLSIPSTSKYSSYCFTISLVVLCGGMLIAASTLEHWLGWRYPGAFIATLAGYAVLFITIALLKRH